MNTNSVEIAAKSINKLEGIKVSDIVIKLGMIPNKNNNREISKVLLSLGWTKGEKKVSNNEGRSYLWFSPVNQFTNIDTFELNKLKEETTQFLREKQELQTKLDKATMELRNLKGKLQDDLENMKKQASMELEGTLKTQKEETKERVREADYDKIDAFFNNYKDTEDTKKDWELDFERKIANSFTLAQ